MKLNNRFFALDVFRGMTICFMIIVNTSGNGATTFAPLKHIDWNGFTPTDLVFPSFLFAVGNALSFVSEKWAKMAQSKVLWKIFKRTFLIFLLGYLMYWFPFFRVDEHFNTHSFPISDTRIFGVLQRIALCYGIGALMVYYFKPRTNVIISAIILFAYWLLFINYGSYDMHHNPILDLDLKLFGENHLYHGEGFAFDPEGLMSTFPAIVNVIGGYFAGVYIQKKGKTFEGLAKLLLVGFLLIALAFMWNYGFQINKKLWTSSYVLLTVGLDLMIISAIIYYTDFLHQTRGTYFFEVFGKNPLVIYLLSELLVIIFYITPIGNINSWGWTYQNIFQHFGDYTGAFLMAIAYMLLCWSVGYFMDKKKIYVKL